MSTISDKERAESLLMSALDEISFALEGKIKFKTHDVIDKDGDLIKKVRVENTINNYDEAIINYYFHKEKIFPATFNYFNRIKMDCDSLADINTFIERIVSDESFMIKVIRVAENTEVINNDDNDNHSIPF